MPLYVNAMQLLHGQLSMRSDDSAVHPVQKAVDNALLAKSRRDYEGALAELRKGFSSAPQAFRNAQLWAALFNSPSWFTDEAEHERYLVYADSVMAMLEATCQAVDARLGYELAHHFLMGAQFRHTVHNDRMLTGFMTRRATLFGYALLGIGVPRGHVFNGPVSNSDRPRLGVLFKHLREDPETTSVLPFFQTAKKSGIEVILFVSEAQGRARLIRHLQEVCNRIVPLPTNVADAVGALRREDLDLLLFGNDITAKPSLHAFLSFFRVARRMICCVSTLVTTASPQMDVYFGSEYYAARGCDSEFVEQFVALPDPGFAFTFPGKQSIPLTEVVDRQALDIEPEALVLTSGANHTKLHGDLVAVWADILVRLPNAKLLLYPFPPHFGAAGAELEQRLRGQFVASGIDPQRLVLSAPLPGRDAVIAMLRHADLGLDSFPYTGVTTIVDAVEAGLPTVSLAGRTLRTAQGAAILHSVGMDELIVESRSDYIDLAVTLGKDLERRRKLQERMAAVARGVPPFLDTDRFGDAVVRAYYRLHGEMASMV